MRTYVAERCFGRPVDLDDPAVRSNLQPLPVQEGIVRYLAREIGRLTIERLPLEFQNEHNRLSNTTAFWWRRDLPLLSCDKTIFNHVATYNPFEHAFAAFLDTAADVLRFASLGTTQQGDSGCRFRVDYLKASGSIAFYHPDWVVVQSSPEGEVSWIVETKGRVWEGTADKDAAMRGWCERIGERTGQRWMFERINQVVFEAAEPMTLAEAVEAEKRAATTLV